jgi:hypothetical protein
MRSVLAVARLICVRWRMRWGRESLHTCSEKEGTKPPYVCPGCSNHTHGNNMINRCNVINKRVIFLT